MAIVKASQRSARPIAMDLDDLARRGEMVLEHARERAGRILKEARAERARLIETAQRDGRDRGEKEGYEAGHSLGVAEGRAAALAQTTEQIASLTKSLTSEIQRYQHKREALIAEARDDLLRLALRLVQSITRRQLQRDPGVLGEIMSDVIEQISDVSSLVVCVHPGDEAVLRLAMPAIVARFDSGAHVELRADDSLHPGSCVIKGERGVVCDAGIDTQIQRITQTLLPDAQGGVAA